MWMVVSVNSFGETFVNFYFKRVALAIAEWSTYATNSDALVNAPTYLSWAQSPVTVFFPIGKCKKRDNNNLRRKDQEILCLSLKYSAYGVCPLCNGEI